MMHDGKIRDYLSVVRTVNCRRAQGTEHFALIRHKKTHKNFRVETSWETATKKTGKKLEQSLFYAAFLHGLPFNPEHGGDIFIGDVGRISADYRTLHRRRQNSSKRVRFEIPSTVKIHTMVFCNMTECSPVSEFQRFGGHTVPIFRTQVIMEVVCFLETFFPSTKHTVSKCRNHNIVHKNLYSDEGSCTFWNVHYT
jgi:hypothetical protein